MNEATIDTEALRFAPWDFKKPRSVLNDYDLDVVAYGVSSALHYCTGTRQCSVGDYPLCTMCGNAVRLVIQSAEPKIVDALVRRMARAAGRENIDLHPQLSGDD